MVEKFALVGFKEMSSFGRVFRVTTFGESHGGAVGCIVEVLFLISCFRFVDFVLVKGVPPRMHLVAADVQKQLDRRRPGQSAITTDRQEGDEVVILSGTELGRTLGSPICMMVRNTDHRPKDYSEMSQVQVIVFLPRFCFKKKETRFLGPVMQITHTWPNMASMPRRVEVEQVLERLLAELLLELSQKSGCSRCLE
jgi:hypothetical protein